MTPGMDEIDTLLDGYRAFRKTGYLAEKSRWAELVDGQSPRVMVIACSDSRVEPSQIFGTRPGEIFVVRNVAALVPPFETTPGHHGVSAALEFAVEVLEVRVIVVMGHGRCGGCHAALTKSMQGALPGEGGFIADWISLLDDARDAVLADYDDAESLHALRAMEEAAVGVSIDNLRSFPNIAAREAAGSLKLVGAVFAIADGVLHLRDAQSGKFGPVA